MVGFLCVVFCLFALFFQFLHKLGIKLFEWLVWIFFPVWISMCPVENIQEEIVKAI